MGKIIIKLSGGLGNQMFQYAFGLKMSLIAKKDLVLDLTFFDKKHDANTTPRNYQMGNYELNETVKLVRNSLLNKAFLMKMNERFYKYFPSFFYTFHNEKKFSFDNNNLVYRGNCVYSGYWQSYKYFDDIFEDLKNAFSLVHKLSFDNERNLENILSTNSVALHIRRGDYVTNLMASDFHGLCTPDYYKEAVSKIESIISNPKFFVFTDDPEWVRNNFKLKHEMHLIEGNDHNAEIDIFLFSHCKAHIIANSSFSWWGAYLAGKSSRCVIRPRRWFQKNDIDSSDLCPKEWVSI